ncbi:hypothetical protein ACN2AP_06015, partial [Klebsiella pneumoniae]
KSAQIREILINESAWEEMTCLFALSLIKIVEDDLFDHIPILHSGFNGSARTFSGTLNYGCVTARSILLKSMVRMQEGE